MRFDRYAGTAFLLVFSLLSCGDGSEGDRVLAQVGDWELTASEFEQEIRRQTEAGRRDSDAFRRKLIEDRVLRAVLAENAREAGYYEHPEVVAELDRIVIAQFVDEEMRERLSGIRVDADEVEASYEAQLERFTTPERARVAAILIPVPARASAAARQSRFDKAEAALAAVREQASDPNAPRSFGAIAVRYSEDQASRYVGGDLGWIDRDTRRGQWGPELARAALALEEPGDLSPLLETPAGFAIVKLLERRAETIRPFDDVAGELRERMLAAKRSRAHEAFLAEMRATVGVELDEAVLAELTSTSSHQPMRSGSAPRPPALPGG